jgi:hypothetical protein
MLSTDSSCQKLDAAGDVVYVPYLAFLGWAGTVYLVIFLPKLPYIHRIYMVLANPLHINYCAI